jgi:diaminohydroxyphosphoribosylaminopyrimidine deaminase/5-amino-6-(5-phosphoribosylamino)uracil reductase
MLIPSSTDDFSQRDQAWMERTLTLAAKGLGLTHPNPMVGCVIEKDGEICGEGFHRYDLRDHAEIVALKVADADARGATLYVSLEPCSHTGRTGPCTNAIIEAGVKRVVVAMEDPNPRVAGKGIKQLRRAGIEVTVGVGEEQARRLNVDFARWIRTKRPLVTLKSAMTLDGKIAERAQRPSQITNELSREAVQRLRHEADAVLTGIGTVLADDPQLTDRTGAARRRKLLRVVVDSKLRIPLKSKLVRSCDGDVLIFTTAALNSTRARALTRAGVEVVRARAVRRRVDLRAALKELGLRGILNLLLEAGSELNAAALEASVVDRLILFYAPRIMGGGVPMAGTDTMRILRPSNLHDVCFTPYGSDFMVEGYIRDVYRNRRTSRNN